MGNTVKPCHITLSAIQLCSVPNIKENLARIKQELTQLTSSSQHDEHHAHIVVLPECCLFFGGAEEAQLALAKADSLTHEITHTLAELALQFHIYLVAGSIPVLAESGDKFTNSSLIFSPQGELLSRYDKIHLFDVVVDDASKNYLESLYTQAGSSVTSCTISDITLGQTVCYDLRFPELFRSLTQQGAQVIVVPSAFTKVTGKAHWQALLQARAIENQVYIVAAGQSGTHENGRETYGHSMIINPWGEIESCLPQGVGSISTTFERSKLLHVRESMPVMTHTAFKTELKTL